MTRASVRGLVPTCTPRTFESRAVDLPGLADMHRALLRDEAALGGSPFDPAFDAVRWVEARLRRSDLRLWIAEAGGEVVGYGECALLRGRRRRFDPRRVVERLWGMRASEGSVNFVYVRPAARGQGVGKALVDGMVAWMRAHGVRTVHDHALARNAASLALFERAGFAPLGVHLRRVDEQAPVPQKTQRPACRGDGR